MEPRSAWRHRLARGLRALRAGDAGGVPAWAGLGGVAALLGAARRRRRPPGGRRDCGAALDLAEDGVVAEVLGGLRGGGAGAAAAAGGGRAVEVGLEVLLRDRRECGSLVGKRVGVVSNPTGVLPDSLQHAVDALQAAGRCRVAAAFGPEHGFRGDRQAGEAEAGAKGGAVDRRSGVPCFDIYRKAGAQLARVFEAAGVEALVVDLQDVGARFYTYIWTLYDCLEAAASMDPPLPVVVLDRPNPVGGLAVRGPLVADSEASFVGRAPIPVQHGLTIGELALLFNAEFIGPKCGAPAPLEVVKMRGWRRGMFFRDTGLPWVAPSPNMPTPDTALVYPGMCLLEGTNVSEGRGTTQPFETFGAPWVDGRLLGRLAEAVDRGKLLGVRFREAHFVPTFGKHAKQPVAGLQVHVQDRRVFDPLRTALEILIQLRALYPGQFQFTAAFGGGHFFDKLAGTPAVRRRIEAGAGLDAVVACWQEDLMWFRRTRTRFLLY